MVKATDTKTCLFILDSHLSPCIHCYRLVSRNHLYKSTAVYLLMRTSRTDNLYMFDSQFPGPSPVHFCHNEYDLHQMKLLKRRSKTHRTIQPRISSCQVLGNCKVLLCNMFFRESKPLFN
jgi:hypothetical protein